MEENAKVLDSIQGRINLFNNALQTMWNNALDSDLIKGVVNLGTELIKVIDNIGPITTAITVFTASKLIPWLLTLTTGTKTFGAALAKILSPLVTFSSTGKTVSATLSALGASAGASATGFTALKIAGQGALVVLKALFTTPLGWLTLAAGAIAGVAAAVSSANRKLKELRESAINTANAFKEQNKQLKDYKTQIRDLRQELDNGNLSESEAYRTREQLISIQKDLIDNFGLEAKGINLVTGAIESQINAINQLDKKNAQAWLYQNYKAINNATDYFENGASGGVFGAGVINWGITKSVKKSVSEHAKERPNTLFNKALLTPESDLEFSGTPDEIKTEMEHWMDWFKQEEDNINKDITNAYADNNHKLVASLQDDLAQVKDFLEDLGAEYTKYFGDGSEYTENKKILEQAQKNTAITQYADQMYEITAAEEAYQEALKSGDTEGINQALTDINIALEGASTDAKANGQQFMVEYFNGIKEGYKDAQFQNILSTDDNLKTKVTEALTYFDDTLELSNTNQHTADQQNAYSTLIDVANEYGYTIKDLIELLTSLGYIKAEPTIEIKEETSITDSLNKISSLEEAYNSLGDAIKEFKEEGTASYSTLEGLKETFGETDGFEELYKTLATGEGDIEKSIANVANAYINQKGMLAELSEDERQIMIERLKSLGVINAEEIIQSRQVAQEKLNTAYQQYSIDLSNYATAEEAKLAIAQQAGLDFSKINDENLKDLANHYGIDLSNYATLAEQKIAIAREMAKETAEANKTTALSDLDQEYASKGYAGSEKYRSDDYKNRRQAIIDEYNNTIASIPSDSTFGNIQSILNGYYDKIFNFDFNNQIGIGRNFADDLVDKTTSDAIDAFQKEMEYWENQIGANQAKYEQVQNEIDILEKQGKRAGKDYYLQQIKLEEDRRDLLEKQEAKATAMLGSFDRGSDEWWDAANTLNNIRGELDDVTASIQDLNDAIDQIHWDTFDEVHTRFDNLIGQLGSVREILSANEDIFFNDEGEWTEKGVAVLGTHIQELKLYKNALNDINTELGRLSLDDFDSEQEYYNKLTELTEKQHDYTIAISNSEQAVIDMYESQIDAIEEWASEAIEAYNDYIDVVKESLDAERELYKFKKDIQKQTKDIASLERRIASLSGSNNASDIAERRKLEAELYEAKEGLNDTYYDHAKDQQSQALDDESQAYEQSMNNYIEKLRTSLDEAQLDMQAFMDGVTASVMLNANIISKEYDKTGLELDESLTTPWDSAAEAVKKYQNDSLSLMNSWTKEEGFFGKFKTDATIQLTSPWIAGENAAGSFQFTVGTVMNGIYESVKSNVENSITKLNDLAAEIAKINTTDVKPNITGGNPPPSGTPSTGGIPYSNEYNSDVAALQGILNSVWSSKLNEDGIWGSKTKTALTNAQQRIQTFFKSMGQRYLSSVSGKFDANTRANMLSYFNYMGRTAKNNDDPHAEQIYLNAAKKLPAAFHAKGTLSITKDQLAITDESWIGEEITLAAGKNGQLQYLKKGSAVMPADISANLVEWGKLNPDMMNIGGVPNLNMISNAVNKPEFNLSFEALVKADRIDEGTLPEIKKYVTQEINSLVKQMNYAIKGYSR